MRKPGTKITLAQGARQGDTTLIIYCETLIPDRPAPYGGGPNVCGHKHEMPMADAIALFGEKTRYDELPIRCSVCGGRDYTARGLTT
jgi:hypothetical protein